MAKSEKKAPKSEKKADKKAPEAKKEPSLNPKAHLHIPKPDGEKTQKIKPLVNMSCPDGTQLKAGETAYVTPTEFNRLKADKRGNLIEEAK